MSTLAARHITGHATTPTALGGRKIRGDSHMLNIFVVLQTMFLDRIETARDNERGATAVEYGLLVALIAAVIVAIVATLGTQINTAFTSVSSKL